MGFEHYDVFVIGTGTAGQKVAEGCAREGMKVAIADNREYGGTCPNRGCDPKKVLVNASELIARTSDMAAVGVTDVAPIDWKALQKFKEKFVSAVPIRTEEGFKKLGITMYHQSPAFLEENMLIVEGKKITADKIVIATGKIPRQLNIEGAHLLKNSDDFLALPALPDSMIFIGAGYIAMEFAHIAARCGVTVTIIERGPRILQIFDEGITTHLQKVSEDIGIKFIFNATVTGAELLRKNTEVSYEKDGKKGAAKSAIVYNTAGRVPSVQDLDLEKGNVQASANGIAVNEFLQNPTNKNVYACGDVSDSGSLPLTPLSGLEGKHVAKTLISGKHSKFTFPVIPTAVYTQPQLASVGISEQEAKDQGIDYKVKENHVPDWFNAKRINSQDYCYKTILTEDGEKILGAQILAPEASEMINLFSMAIRLGMTCREFREGIFAYPSFASDAQSMV